MTSLVLFALVILMPNPALTPGRVRPLTQEVICATRWGTDRRVVTEAMKRHVSYAYGILLRSDWSLYEFDHLIPRSLGGADDILNIWPQVWAEARQKDVAEVRASRNVCAGTLSLRATQRLFATWPSGKEQP